MSLKQKEQNNFKNNTDTLMFYQLPPDDDHNELPLTFNSEIGFLNYFLSAAFTEKENNLASAWTGHEPFLFCLLHYTKPRRFVELGTHKGNSFFAACQISQTMNNTIECIAIDTWEGDEHAGFYSNKVFENFKRDFIKYDNIAKYIRKRFSEAVSMFENKSIDILHIDGLHTYEAVKEDFETWLPKLSDLGIILLHDTQAKTKDFGVWKLWEELQNTYPSFEFEHSHGLGVLLVGQNPPAHIKFLFNAMKKKEVVQLVKYFFSGIAGVEKSKKVLKQSIKRSVQKEYKKSYTWRIGRLFTYLPSQFYKLIKKQKREQL